MADNTGAFLETIVFASHTPEQKRRLNSLVCLAVSVFTFTQAAAVNVWAH